jgi:hypothetical protein
MGATVIPCPPETNAPFEGATTISAVAAAAPTVVSNKAVPTAMDSFIIVLRSISTSCIWSVSDKKTSRTAK